ncbi:MAG TPA: hypothetical protein VGK59_10920 [Ohtaekwangia sp.]
MVDKDKKKFKDTKVGKFLQEKVPDVLDIVADVLPDQGALGIVKNILDKKPDVPPELKAEFMQRMYEFETEILLMELQDRQNARAMQVAALQQDDKFSKRFLYVLSAFVILTATVFGVMLFLVEFPESNRRLVEMYSDVYLFAGALMVLQFFYGSSKSSHDKTKMLQTP